MSYVERGPMPVAAVRLGKVSACDADSADSLATWALGRDVTRCAFFALRRDGYWYRVDFGGGDIRTFIDALTAGAAQ